MFKKKKDSNLKVLTMSIATLIREMGHEIIRPEANKLRILSKTLLRNQK